MPKILAIDDKQDNLITLSAILKNLIPECQVIIAQSGPEGLEKAKIHSPDTIISDIKMPGMDGYEVCKKLKKDKATSEIPVILISAIQTGPKDLVKGLDAGADAYLAKPVDEHILIAQVKTALRMKKAEDHLRRQKDSLEETVRERTAELINSNVQLKREIADRKQAEEALRKSEERFRRYFELSTIGMAITSPEGGGIDVNARICEILGYTREELSEMTWAEITHPDDLQADVAQFNRLLSGEIERYSMDKRFIRKDGDIIYGQRSGVLKEYRGHGIQKRFIKRRHEFFGKGVTHITYVHPENPASINSFISTGYKTFWPEDPYGGYDKVYFKKEIK